MRFSLIFSMKGNFARSSPLRPFSLLSPPRWCSFFAFAISKNAIAWADLAEARLRIQLKRPPEQRTWGDFRAALAKATDVSVAGNLPSAWRLKLLEAEYQAAREAQAAAGAAAGEAQSAAAAAAGGGAQGAS